jgi:hypothetical protein
MPTGCRSVYLCDVSRCPAEFALGHPTCSLSRTSCRKSGHARIPPWCLMGVKGVGWWWWEKGLAGGGAVVVGDAPRYQVSAVGDPDRAAPGAAEGTLFLGSEERGDNVVRVQVKRQVAASGEQHSGVPVVEVRNKIGVVAGGTEAVLPITSRWGRCAFKVSEEGRWGK